MNGKIYIKTIGLCNKLDHVMIKKNSVHFF